MSDGPSIDSIFCAAIEIESPEERQAAVERACAGDHELKRQVERLLRAHVHGRGILDAPAQTVISDSEPINEREATVIGPYKLVEPIGEGGMGTVWMAQQTEPVRRLVALKLIKAGMDSRQVIARFEAERQALALMDHANIARVLDAGTTSAGRPYFVMDLVKGVPITKYCDDHHLTPRQRLELFIPVCEAVQHAHQKGIIHRDIKPSNVLVALYDGKPVPKVIDFGVAKAAGQRLTDKTLITGFGAIVGTLEYMSPEQADLNQLDIDARSDVYSLGVLLYELLTGMTPFSRKELEKTGMLEMLRVIREQEPKTPSTKLSTAEGLPALAANRGIEPARLAKMVRGELDWIAMKALEKDRDRRYQTANSLAMDVQRYLADETVLASPPSAGYRLWKLARRNRRALMAVTAFVLLLVTAVVALSIAVVALNRERQQKVAALEAEGKRRKQTRAALDDMSSQVIEDWLAKQPAYSNEQKQFLERALRHYKEFATDNGQDEESRASVALAFDRVGFIRERLGQFGEAETAYVRSQKLCAALVADFPKTPNYRHMLATEIKRLGTLYSKIRRTSEAEKLLLLSVNIHRELATEFADISAYKSHLAKDLNRIGIVYKDLGRIDDAINVSREAAEIHKQLVAEFAGDPGSRDDLAQAWATLGDVLEFADRPRDAEEPLAQAVAIYKELARDFPKEPHYRDMLAISSHNRGEAVRLAGRKHEAEEIFRQVLTIRRQLADEFPAVPAYRRGLAITLNNLGIVLKDTGRRPEAEDVYRQALAVHKRLAADYPAVAGHQNETAGAMVNLARLLLERGQLDGARQLLIEALPYHRAVLEASPGHPSYRMFYRNNRWRLAETLLELKDHAAAAEAAGQFLQAAVERPRDAYTSSCLLAGCARLAATDDRLAESKRNELSSAYGALRRRRLATGDR